MKISTLSALLFAVLAAVLLRNIIRCLRAKNAEESVSPLFFISATFFVYGIVGPLYFILVQGELMYVTADLRPFVDLSYAGALLSYLSILIGYRLNLFNGRNAPPDGIRTEYNDKLLITIFLLFGLIAYCYIRNYSLNDLLFGDDGFDIEDSDNSKLGFIGTFPSLCIPAVLLLMRRWFLRRSTLSLILLIVSAVLTVLLFLLSGYRINLFLLFIGGVTFFCLMAKKRLRLWLLVSAFVVLIPCLGIIAMTRQYNHGLNLSTLEGRTSDDVVGAAFNETKVFFTSGGLMEFSRKFGYIGLDRYWLAITCLVPRGLCPWKPMPTHLGDAAEWFTGTRKFGIAYMNFGDAFAALSWFGIVINGLAIGIFARRLWEYYKADRRPGCC